MSYEKLLEEARQFWLDHPEVYQLVERYALQARNSGRRHYGIATVWERVRWETRIVGGMDWKMPNNHRAFYARAFNHKHTEMLCACGSGFFRIAEQRSKRTTPEPVAPSPSIAAAGIPTHQLSLIK